MARILLKQFNISCQFHLRNWSVRGLKSKQLEFEEFGEPLKVLKLVERQVPPISSKQVLVRIRAAIFNPSDINTIQGKYPIKLKLPHVGGSQCVGIVEEVGKDVKGIRPGNKVITTAVAQGTWRNIATFNENVLKVVPDSLGDIEAATLMGNPCSAYRMLTDYAPIKDGLVVIQNAGNSACGQNITQICKAWGVENVSIVRNRPEIEETKRYLQRLGATYVLTEDEVRSTTLFKDKTIDMPALALDCVGGRSSYEMLRHLKNSGKMVTYGGMSLEPVKIPASALIFRNLSFHGFWQILWMKSATQADKDKMYDDVLSLMLENKLKAPVHKIITLEDYKEAIGNTLNPKGFVGCKYVINFS